MRDLTADLATCAAATSGPWKERRGSVMAGDRLVLRREPMARGYGGGDPSTHVESMVANATFAANARTGWPEAIKRALSAERRASLAEESLQSILRCLAWEAEDWEAYKRYRANESRLSTLAAELSYMTARAISAEGRLAI